jgi:hypothetical protein
MTLRQFVSEHQRIIFEALQRGLEPPIGAYDPDTFKECRRRTQVQTGTMRYRQDRLLFEFIYHEPSLGPAVLTVEVSTPEPLVYMPVPEWVIEDVWQGEVTGSFRFESEARQLLQNYSEPLFSEANLAFFADRQPPKRRE